MKSPTRRTVRSFERSKAKNVAGRARTEKNASEFGLPKVQNARPLPHSGKTTCSKTGSNPTDWASAYGKFETTNPNVKARTVSVRNRVEESAIPQKNAARLTKTETEYARPERASSVGWNPWSTANPTMTADVATAAKIHRRENRKDSSGRDPSGDIRRIATFAHTVAVRTKRKAIFTPS